MNEKKKKALIVVLMVLFVIGAIVDIAITVMIAKVDPLALAGDNIILQFVRQPKLTAIGLGVGALMVADVYAINWLSK